MFNNKKRRFLEGDPIDPGKPDTTVVAAGATVDGDLKAPGDALVRGTVRGRLECGGRVHLFAGAAVRGALTAAAAKVEGEVEGPVTVSGRLEIGSAARVFGDLRAGQLAIAEGSLVKGALQAEAPPHRFVDRRTAEVPAEVSE
ncbi:MAG TPA: polymer-forming cytoskeletal protein [Candidatus Polarisedimenticolaceae bacterium]